MSHLCESRSTDDGSCSGVVRFEAQKATTLNGRRYHEGDVIEAQFPMSARVSACDRARRFLEARLGEGGAWGVGGFTSRAIAAAADITDLR